MAWVFALQKPVVGVVHNAGMLLAYIDEIGEPGAFVSRSDPRYNTSAAFGYAGFVIPEGQARRFGSHFTGEKRRLFATELTSVDNVGRWERKGASIFRPETVDRFPQQIRVFNALVRKLRSLGGQLFYYADEKPVGTPKQTRLDTKDRETRAMRETLNRLARHSESVDANLLILIDQVNEKQRSERIRSMYAHIFSRSTEHEEMTRIVEPPMHIDSQLSAGVQFADWVAACVTRALEYQILDDPTCPWVVKSRAVDAARGAFTHESKLRLYQRDVDDLHHSEIFQATRPLYPQAQGQLLGAHVAPAALRRLRGRSEPNLGRPFSSG